ncbi:alpha/beta hydrolase [Methylomonas rivi]|uniref:Lysophospholipase n=1 Tax=Methylomonas rivi TaxID=2952226 RepID=A0ABT1U564_9GAMM|nr:alpha/beta hydrolase [Methylomonas sp. WSC-6]MCQ8129002.1 lysophospholipase [Methylomonas sp. WSC-6]
MIACINYYSFKTHRLTLWLLLAGLFTAGCAPVMKAPGPSIGAPQLTADSFIAADGVQLRLSRWPADNPKAVIIALHGFNDYRRFFGAPADYLQKQRIYCYAYDQRGFGESATPGIWAGSDAYAGDLRQIAALIQAEHPGIPIYLLGESMGGAVIIDAMSRREKPDAAGVILSAPAVWGRETMPWYQTSLLWTLSHTVPWMALTGRDLGIVPSDNIEMLRALGRDPLVIKETRVDAIYGLTNLMDSALNAADKLNADTLLLYGEKDQIVPREPTRRFVHELLGSHPGKNTVGYYRNGYHMLLRDLQAPVIWQDIAHWILDNKAELPSGADRNLDKLVRRQTEYTDEIVGQLNSSR